MLGQIAHRFVRNPNTASSTFYRVGNRSNPFANTLSILEDPASQRKLFLIGTTNSSTLLALRTQKLIQVEKPDAVFVQVNKAWADTVKNIQAESQSELDEYRALLNSSFKVEYSNNIRGIVFKLRLYSWLAVANLIKAFPSDFHPFVPGLEMKLTLEEAEKLKANVEFLGLELDEKTQYALLTEKRMDFPFLFLRSLTALHNKLWKGESHDHWRVLHTQGGEAFAESMDKSRLNWLIKYFEKIAPKQKEIFIDKKDVDLFHSIYKSNGKKIVAVVNQWHVPGIEAHWRHTTGTEEKKELINPVGDFDIEEIMEANLVNDKLREIVSKNAKSEPATWSNYLGTYIKENTEYHRVRHVSFLGHDDPDMYHGLPYGSHDAHNDGHGHKKEGNEGKKH